MILNAERDALIRDLITHLHDHGRRDDDDEARDLADCISYMHKLWKLEVRQRYIGKVTENEREF